MNRYKKSISMILIPAFALLLFMHASPVEHGKNPKESESSAHLEYPNVGDSGAFEQEGGVAVKTGKKRFPWLCVAVGVIVVGIFVYLLVKKTPEYKLMVDLDPSVMGSPASGTTFFKKGQSANYEYAARPGFDEVTVLMDGVKVQSSGSIKMNRDHTIKASALPITYTLTVNLGAGATGTPPSGASTLAYHESVPYSYAAVNGYRNPKVLLDGTAVPADGTILMDRDHTLEVSADKASPQWDFTYTSNARGTFHTVLTFDEVPPYSIGHVTANGGNWDLWTSGRYSIEGKKIWIYFNMWPANHAFYGSFSDADHMNGYYVLEYGDPPVSKDTGTWSAQRR